MYHYFDTLTNTRGDSLVGYSVRLRDFENPTGLVIPLYADESGTPIATASGLVNQARSDGTGFFDFWVNDGVYTLEVMTPGGAVTRTIRGVAMTTANGGGGGDPTDDEGIWNPNAAIIDNEGIWSA